MGLKLFNSDLTDTKASNVIHLFQTTCIPTFTVEGSSTNKKTSSMYSIDFSDVIYSNTISNSFGGVLGKSLIKKRSKIHNLRHSGIVKLNSYSIIAGAKRLETDTLYQPINSPVILGMSSTIAAAYKAFANVIEVDGFLYINWNYNELISNSTSI